MKAKSLMGLFCLGLVTLGYGNSIKETTKPNIIIIFNDDQGFGSYYGIPYSNDMYPAKNMKCAFCSDFNSKKVIQQKIINDDEVSYKFF